MNENIDLTKILEDCPKGTTFWSDNYGEVKFLYIDKRFDEPIVTKRTDGYPSSYTKEGWVSRLFPASCLLWPSKDCRDWSKFTAPWYKNEELIKPKFKVGDIIKHKGADKDDVYEINKVYNDSYSVFGSSQPLYIKYQDLYELVPNKFDPHTLRPFDKVIARKDSEDSWNIDFFSCFKLKELPFCLGGLKYAVIPYNEDTKHLVGATEEAPEFYRYWED